jgi:hypothetical protein
MPARAQQLDRLHEAPGDEHYHEREGCAVEHEPKIPHAPQQFRQYREQDRSPYGPDQLPIPPTMTIARIVNDSVMLKASGTSVPTKLA